MNRNKYNFMIVVQAAACVVSGTVFYWFKNLPGIPGLITWNPEYYTVIMILGTLVLIPAAVFAFTVLFIKPDQKASKIKNIAAAASTVLACIIGIGAALSFAALQIKAYKTPADIPPMNILPSGNSLPSRTGEGPLLKFTVSSDPHWGREESSAQARNAVIQRVDNSGSDVFFLIGDIAEMGSNPAEYREAAQDISTNLKKVPLFAFPGNHDAMVNGLNQFRQYFTADKRSSRNFYTRLDGGSVHVIVIDALWGPEDGGQRQLTWLEKQLSSIPADETVIVMSHCFYFSSGYIDEDTHKKWYDHPSMIQTYSPLFEKYKVDLVISGHNHLMELIKHNGVHYAVIGTMGGKLDSRGDYISPGSLFLDRTSFGYLDVTVWKNKADISFIDDSGAAKMTASIQTSGK